MNDEIGFTLMGDRYRMTRDQFEVRLGAAEPEPVTKYFVAVNGRHFPVKQAAAVGFGMAGHRSKFTSQEAIRALRKLGYKAHIVTETKDREQEFVLSGVRYCITPSRFAERLADVKPEPVTKHYVGVAGRRFPVKQAVSVGLDVPRLNFTTQDAIRVLRKLGFNPIEGAGTS